MEESTKNIKPKTGDYLYCIEDIIKKSGPEKGLKSFIAGHYYKIWFSEEHINIVESELGRDANFYTESIPKYFIVIPGEDYEKHQNFDPFNLNESKYPGITRKPKVGDRVIVNGWYGEEGEGPRDIVLKFDNELGTIVDVDVAPGLSFPRGGEVIISFDRWRLPSEDDGGFEYIDDSCFGKKCMQFSNLLRNDYDFSIKPLSKDMDVKDFDAFENLYESEDDDLEWAQEIVDNVNNIDTTNLKGKAWEILLPGPEEDFIEAQKWAFNRGFKWEGVEGLLDSGEYPYSTICSIGNIFHDNIKNSTLTYGGSGKCNRESRLRETTRIAKDHARTDELYVFDWDSNKKEAILTEIVNLKSINESEEFNWVEDIETPEINPLLTIGSYFKAGYKDYPIIIKIINISNPNDSIEGEFKIIFESFNTGNDGEWDKNSVELSQANALVNKTHQNYWWTPISKEKISKLYDPEKYKNFLQNNLNESDDLEWARDAITDDILAFHDKEYMIDVRGFNEKSLIKLYELLRPYFNEEANRPDSYSDQSSRCILNKSNLKSISLHCGVEENEWQPLKGQICCLNYTFDEEKEANKNTIIPMDGRVLLGMDSIEMNESEEDDSLEWAQDIVNSESIDITKNEEQIDLLKNGSVMSITGDWESLSFNNDRATIIELGNKNLSSLLKFDRVVESGDDHSHCGEYEHHKICECEDNNVVGKCWYTDISSMDRVIWYPYEYNETLNESEEDDSLEWAQDIVSNVDSEIRYSNFKKDGKLLPDGAILKITGYQDDIDFNNQECKIIRFMDEENDRYLCVFPEYIHDEQGGSTHCGSRQDEEKCHCQEKNVGVGRCYEIEMDHMSEVYYYPNRVKLTNESEEEKPLLTEGRYDAITRKAVNDIMVVVKETANQTEFNQAVLPSGLGGDEEYTQEGMSFSIELNIHHQPLFNDKVVTKESEAYYVHTAVADEEDENVIMMTIVVDPAWEPQIYERLFYKLQEDIRHEIEHLTQLGIHRISDRPTSRTNTAQLKTTFGHHKHKLEVPALVHGFYRRAKLEKRPIDEVMIEDLDSEIERGNLTKRAAQSLLAIWVDYAKKNLPAAIYSQE